MAAFFWAPPSAQTLAIARQKIEDFPQPRAELWPDHEAAFELFCRLHTQWRVGAAGPVGLDYTVVFHELDRQGLSRDEYDETMALLGLIERAALEEIHKS